MITMLWKELRENLKWAVLAMIGLAMAEFYALNQTAVFRLPMWRGLLPCARARS